MHVILRANACGYIAMRKNVCISDANPVSPAYVRTKAGVIVVIVRGGGEKKK